MVATLHVGGGAGGDAGIPQGAGGVSPDVLREQNDTADAAQKEPVDEYLSLFEENGQETGPPVLEPTVLPDGTKEFEITAEVAEWEVEPGTTVAAWTYNGTVPGPTISVEPNDRVRIVLRNELPQSTAIHFHGLETPNAMDGVPWVTQDPVKPGDSHVYEFVANGPAVGMYHSHHHAEHQVPDGLVGALLVGDMALPAGHPGVDQEIPLVLNDAGVIGLSLNGRSFPGTRPIVAGVGETVEIHYFNEGLQIHPMHLHGLPQLVVAKDGFPLPQPYRVDTLNVAPGERYTVLVTPEEHHRGADGAPGVWAFHCHILNHAEREDGMFGMVTTFIVP
jgi:FtsP/CotA-like multicopper oxidase with cupredoxin domain